MQLYPSYLTTITGSKLFNTEDKKKIAIEMYNAGKPPHVILRELGMEASRSSRNSLAGVLFRARKENKLLVQYAPARRVKPKLTRKGNKREMIVPPAIPIVPVVKPIITTAKGDGFFIGSGWFERAVLPKGKYIDELTPFSCRAVIGHSEDGSVFCGAAKCTTAFCDEHAQIYYRPSRKGTGYERVADTYKTKDADDDKPRPQPLRQNTHDHRKAYAEHHPR
jgi:hypothetical protein